MWPNTPPLRLRERPGIGSGHRHLTTEGQTWLLLVPVVLSSGLRSLLGPFLQHTGAQSLSANPGK